MSPDFILKNGIKIFIADKMCFHISLSYLDFFFFLKYRGEEDAFMGNMIESFYQGYKKQKTRLLTLHQLS